MYDIQEKSTEFGETELYIIELLIKAELHVKEQSDIAMRKLKYKQMLTGRIPINVFVQNAEEKYKADMIAFKEKILSQQTKNIPSPGEKQNIEPHISKPAVSKPRRHSLVGIEMSKFKVIFNINTYSLLYIRQLYNMTIF